MTSARASRIAPLTVLALALVVTSMVCSACSGAFTVDVRDAGERPSTDASKPESDSGIGPETKDASPPPTDAGADAAVGCVALTLDGVNGRAPILAGRATMQGGALVLLPTSELLFNQSGTATFGFPASTRVTGKYTLAVGKIMVSGWGDGVAMGFYPGALGAPSRSLLGLPEGPGLGVFLESFRSSMSAARRDAISAGDFVAARPTTSLLGLDPVPFTLAVHFTYASGALTLDGVPGTIMSAHKSISSLALGAACTNENPQGFAITDFSATACP